MLLRDWGVMGGKGWGAKGPLLLFYSSLSLWGEVFP